MLTIILGICVSFVLGFGVCERLPDLHPLRCAIAFFAVVILCFSIVGGLTFPLSGYGEKELKEKIPLIPFSSSTEDTNNTDLVYVARSYDDVYTYNCKTSLSDTLTTTATKRITKSDLSEDIKILEDPECEVPELLVYNQNAKISIWTFGCVSSRTIYIFHIPPNTIVETNPVVKDIN